jgi:hypothetical protein
MHFLEAPLRVRQIRRDASLAPDKGFIGEATIDETNSADCAVIGVIVSRTR